MSARKKVLAVVLLAIVAIAAAGLSLRARATEPKAAGSANSTITVTRSDFVRSLRLSGTVEAVEATNVSAPRLAGQNTNSLVIM
ncbi:MAG TPA: hypothetical protein VFZ98_06970, partial [Vicinamibacterales bacterium]